MGQVVSLVVVAVVCAFGAAAAQAFTYSAKSYVQDGLIGHFDAIENAGYGTHDANTTTWVNLVGTNVMDHFSVTALSKWSWSDTYLGLTTGGNTSSARLITSHPLTLSQFTFENVVRTGSNASCRRWEVTPWVNSFETWDNGSEGYLERIDGTRIAAYTKQTANLDIHFATTYDAFTHVAHAYVDGTRYMKSAGKAKYVFTGNIAFFGAMTDGRVHALRVYNRALTEDELWLNEVLDQLRFYGKTPETVVLPSGCDWRFGTDGILRTVGGKVLLRPLESASARAITAVTFATVDEETVCTVTLAAGDPGVTNAIYLVWGEKDYGEEAGAWPGLSRLKRVLPEDESVSFTLPSACVTYAPNVYVRVFAAVASRPYDYRLSAIGASGTQWLDTGYYANPKTVADFTAQLTDMTPQQRVFGADEDNEGDAYFSFSCYINGGSNWSCSYNDAKGCWHSTGKLAKNEPTRIIIDASTGKYTIQSPTYNVTTTMPTGTKLSDGRIVERTRTATASQAIFASARNQNTRHVCHVVDGVIFFGSYAEDGKYVHTYEPCSVDGRAAFYDGVTEAIYFSSSQDDFIAAGTNVDSVVTQGEILSTFSAAMLVPHGVYRVDTGATPVKVDYRLLYTDGGSKSGAAPLELTNADNGFGGVFTVYEGLLAASFGAGLASTDHLVLNGGIWGIPSDMGDVPVGAGAGQVELTGSRAGFGAYASDATLRFNGGTGPFVYPAENLAAETLVLNDAFCAHTLTLAQPLQGAADRVLKVEVGGGTAIFAQPVSASYAFTKEGEGRALFTAAENTFGTLSLSGGSVGFVPSGAAATLSTASLSVNGQTKAVLEKTALVNAGKLNIEVESELAVSNGASLVQSGDVQVGTSGGRGAMRATLTVANASLTAENNKLQLGGSSGGWDIFGDLKLEAGAVLSLKELEGRQGNVVQNGGTVKVTGTDSGSARLGTLAGKVFNYYLYGGSLERVSKNGNFQVGFGKDSSAEGRLYVEKEGHLITHCQYPSFGRHVKTIGRLYVRNGGHYSADFNGSTEIGLCAGDEGSGSIEVASGGEIDLAGYVQIVSSYTHGERDGELRVLKDGILRCRGVWRDTAPCTNASVILDGGLVQVKEGGTVKNPFLVNMTKVQLGVDGTTIDTNGRDILFRQDLAARPNQTWTPPATAAAVAACAAFTKDGVGTLTLEGSNSYAVATCVKAGTFATATAHALPEGGLVKLAGGTLDLKGTSQTIGMLAGNGTVTLGGGTLTVTDTIWPGLGVDGGTLTVSGGTLTATKIRYAVAKDAEGASVCGKLVHGGLLNLTGVEIVVDDVDNLGKRGLTILEAGTLTGTPTWSLPTPYRVVGQGNSLRLVAAVGTTILVR